jgi:hypothetical protein
MKADMIIICNMRQAKALTNDETVLEYHRRYYTMTLPKVQCILGKDDKYERSMESKVIIAVSGESEMVVIEGD